MEVLTWTLTVLSLLGVVLNIRKRKECFYIWGATNFGWMVVDYRAGLTAQAALFSIYFCLALWGLWEWRGEKDDARK